MAQIGLLAAFLPTGDGREKFKDIIQSIDVYNSERGLEPNSKKTNWTASAAASY